MTIAEPGTRTLGKSASLDPDLEDAIREYLRTYVLWRGIGQATETFGVSRHTLWRFLERGHTGRALPRAVLDTVGDSVEVLETATWAIAAAERVVASRPAAKPVLAPYPMSQALEDTLLLLCATPLATVDELSRFGRIPGSTLRDRLRKLAKMGMADSVSHSLGVLGPHPHLRYFPTQKGIDAGAMVEYGTETFLREYPVSRQWYRLLRVTLESLANLAMHDVALVSITENIDYSTPQGRLLVQMLGSFGQFFSDMLGTHVSKGLDQRATLGLHTGGIPFGYQSCWVKEHGERRQTCENEHPGGIHHVPSEAAAIKEMFERYAAGTTTLNQLAAWLNEEGFRTRNTRKMSNPDGSDHSGPQAVHERLSEGHSSQPLLRRAGEAQRRTVSGRS